TFSSYAVYIISASDITSPPTHHTPRQRPPASPPTSPTSTSSSFARTSSSGSPIWSSTPRPTTSHASSSPTRVTSSPASAIAGGVSPACSAAAGRSGQGAGEQRSERAPTPVSEQRSRQRSHGRPRAALVDGNRHPSRAGPRRAAANVEEVGRVQIDDPLRAGDGPVVGDDPFET